MSDKNINNNQNFQWNILLNKLQQNALDTIDAITIINKKLKLYASSKFEYFCLILSFVMFITGVIISKIFSYISVLNEINGALFMVLVLIVTLSIAIKNYLDINIIDKNKIAKDIVVFVLTITITMMSILVIRQ